MASAVGKRSVFYVLHNPQTREFYQRKAAETFGVTVNIRRAADEFPTAEDAWRELERLHRSAVRDGREWIGFGVYRVVVSETMEPVA